MTNTKHSSAAPELLFGTPLSIVVRARAEYVDGSHSSDIGLVIARQHCAGNVPSQRALQLAGRASLRRLNRGPAGQKAVRRLMICIGDQWQPLICSNSPPRPSSKEVTMSRHFRFFDKAPSSSSLSLVAS